MAIHILMLVAYIELVEIYDLHLIIFLRIKNEQIFHIVTVINLKGTLLTEKNLASSLSLTDF